MQKENEISTIDSVLRLLFQPVPYLPEISFLPLGRSEQRKQKALARIKKKTPEERKVRGNLQLLGKGKIKICGHNVEIDESTWVFGDIKDGAVAEMTLMPSGDNFIVKRVVII